MSTADFCMFVIADKDRCKIWKSQRLVAFGSLINPEYFNNALDNSFTSIVSDPGTGAILQQKGPGSY
jgi:hypothetical protein